MDTLPIDIIILIGSMMNDYLSAELLLFSVTANLRAAVRSDEFATLRALAVLERGKHFWDVALSRPTYRTFYSIRWELQNMYRFEKALVRIRLPPWSNECFYAYWKFEESLITM